MTIGADGTPMHSLHASKGGRARVTLLKTSPMNAALTLVYNLQRTSAQLWGQNLLVLTHTSLGDVYTCQSVAFTKFPSNDYGKEARFLVWEFNVGIIDPLLGLGTVGA
jgi:spore coat protein U-like protein